MFAQEHKQKLHIAAFAFVAYLIVASHNKLSSYLYLSNVWLLLLRVKELL